MIGKYLTIAKNGLWNSNTTLVQMLGLCPTLAVTNSAVNALGMGLATTAVLTVSNTLISAVRKTLRPEIRIAVFVLILAGLVTSLELVMEAFVPDIYSALGIFIPLIVTNCIIIGRAESFASRHPVGESLTDGFFTGLGFSIVLLVIGSIREIIGTGHWLAGFEQLIGDAGKNLEAVLFSSDSGVLIAILPPGAFITLGFLVALHNVIEARGKDGRKLRARPGMAAAERSEVKAKESSTLRERKELAGKVYAALAKAIPEPKAELQYGSVYELLTAVMLSAQATDKSVNAVTGELFRLAPTPERMLELGEERVRDIVKTVGLANTKARHIIEAAGILVSEFNGEVPETIEELVRLPGVGEKTAKVVLNVGFGKGVIAVDTHILRVARRLGLSSAKTPAGVSRDLEAITPTDYIRNAHHYLLLHGRYTCKAQRPLCGSCALRDLCRSADSAEGKKAAQGKG